MPPEHRHAIYTGTPFTFEYLHGQGDREVVEELWEEKSDAEKVLVQATQDAENTIDR